MNLNWRVFFKKVAMNVTFCLFLVSMISPMYLFFGDDRVSSVAYGRIPGLGMEFTWTDMLAHGLFFVLLVLFFASHAVYEPRPAKKIFCCLSALYCALYMAVIMLVGSQGFVVFNFPIVSLPIWGVVSSKLLILIPALYFAMLAFDRRARAFVRGAAGFHTIVLVIMGAIKVFEVAFTESLRMLVFDISTTLYFVSLAMITFFMYREYYGEDD